MVKNKKGHEADLDIDRDSLPNSDFDLLYSIFGVSVEDVEMADTILGEERPG